MLVYRCLTSSELESLAYRGDKKAANEFLKRYAGEKFFTEDELELEADIARTEAYEEGYKEGYNEGIDVGKEMGNPDLVSQHR